MVEAADSRMARMQEPSDPKPRSEPEARYPRLSPDQKEQVLNDLREHLELIDLQRRDHPDSLSSYAHASASGLEQRAGFLAASLVAFSGRQPTSGTAADGQIAFENHFEMELAGFEPCTKNVRSLLAPSVSEMANESLFN